ncbi:hypothetical protein HW555_002907 [Spodoptera exigua]|uniref:Uncharacterized protein n=1 Tax=Spodoptera exigua TaxID=7107 RepID=A0A835GP92_SPOEX|nr:hypothetical protein HW555_002907 [Spodoptera exigua]
MLDHMSPRHPRLVFCSTKLCGFIADDQTPTAGHFEPDLVQMFHTPKNMVNTRRTAKKDEEQMEVQPSIQKVPALPTNEEQQPNEDILRRAKLFFFLKRSSSSSVIARKKRLELEATQAKAKIEIDLIEKQLAANLAEIDDECSVQSDHTNKDVEEWLERSHRELEAEPVRDRGQMKVVHCSPAAQNAGTNDVAFKTSGQAPGSSLEKVGIGDDNCLDGDDGVSDTGADCRRGAPIVLAPVCAAHFAHRGDAALFGI